MLKKIDLLENIGRFERLQHRAEGLKRLALVFARNGYGKSTACAVLRSANAQDPQPISERLHLGGKPAAAVLQTEGAGTVAFTNGSWNKAPPPLMVFDGEYIRRNVHAADEVTRENKRGLFQIILGSGGVALAEKLAALAEENGKLNTTIRSLESAITKSAPSASNIAAFVSAKLPDNLEERTRAAASTVSRVERAVDVAQRPKLTTIDFGGDPDELMEILLQEGEAGAQNHQQRLDEHLAKHNMSKQGRGWLRFGLQHTEGDDCPFCDQPLEGSPIIGPLRTVFSDDYKAIIDRCQAQVEALSPLIAEGGQGSISAIYTGNSELLRFWADFCKLPATPHIGDVEIGGLRAIAARLLAAFTTKASNPSASVNIGTDQLQEWRDTIVLLEEYNGQATAVNAAIDELKSEEGQPSKEHVQEARLRLDKYEALKRRDEEPLKTLCEQWRAATKRHKEIATERKQTQEALRAHTKAMAAEYQAGVNELLGLFGTNFRLCQTEPTFKGGGIPNTEYCINVDGFVLPAGESKTPDAPSFRTVLSGGDKASLALALFITQAKKREDLDKTVLVFDDPFNSQDAGRQFETAARIRELAGLASQVLVFSHDERFLHLIQKDSDRPNCSEHQIVFTGDWNGAVSSWDAAKEVTQEYVRKAERIRAYAGSGVCLPDTNEEALASDIRVFLETFLDMRFPGRFAELTSLGAMAEEIADAGDHDPLHKHAQALKELNEYSRPEHHKSASGVNPNQLRAQCRKVVRIIGDY